MMDKIFGYFSKSQQQKNKPPVQQVPQQAQQVPQQIYQQQQPMDLSFPSSSMQVPQPVYQVYQQQQPMDYAFPSSSMQAPQQIYIQQQSVDFVFPSSSMQAPQQIYQQQQAYSNIYTEIPYGQNQGPGTITLLNKKEQDKNLKVVAVIVTFNTGGSYDDLFRTVEQKSMEGTRVQVYACDSQYLPSLMEAFEGNPKDDVAIRLMESVKIVDSDCVVFNWECCGGYGSNMFPEGRDNLFKFVRNMVDKGHMCMFSDFSLKALVQEWDEKYELGPNPFVKTSQLSGHFQINFINAQLKQSPSAQLQIVGDMAEGGRCNIHAMGGTIVYCVDSTKIKHQIYKTQILTVTNIPAPKQQYKSKIGNHQGTAGHVALRYPKGGVILTSMGHWIELMKIDTSEKKLFQVAERQFGVAEASKMRAQYMQMDINTQQQYVQTKARQFVRNQAPCQNMYKKAQF